MTMQATIAAAINGTEYPVRLSAEIIETCKTHGVVIVFGAGDDLMEFRGAINDEISCYDGGTAYLTKAGLLVNDCDSDDCPHFAKLQALAAPIKAIWSDPQDLSWRYETEIPHDTFLVMEDGEAYCIGIVFCLADI